MRSIWAKAAEFGLDEADKPAESWACYIFGVCREIQKRGGKIGGFDTVFAGDVPAGRRHVVVGSAGVDLRLCAERPL